MELIDVKDIQTHRDVEMQRILNILILLIFVICIGFWWNDFIISQAIGDTEQVQTEESETTEEEPDCE